MNYLADLNEYLEAYGCPLVTEDDLYTAEMEKILALLRVMDERIRIQDWELRNPTKERLLRTYDNTPWNNGDHPLYPRNK